MQVNIMGVMEGTQIAMERMKKVKKGTIINTASIAGITIGPNEEMASYFVSKHGVVTLTRSLDAAFEETGVEVKALCPTFADTQLCSQWRKGETGSYDDWAKVMGKLSVERVAEGFYSLLTERPHGSVMPVLINTPNFVLPDTSLATVRVLSILAIMINKLTGASTIQVHHFAYTVAFIMT